MYIQPKQTYKRPQFSLRNEGDDVAITMILIFCTGMKLFHEIFHASADSHVHHNHIQAEPKAWKPGRDVPPGCRGGPPYPPVLTISTCALPDFPAMFFRICHGTNS